MVSGPWAPGLELSGSWHTLRLGNKPGSLSLTPGCLVPVILTSQYFSNPPSPHGGLRVQPTLALSLFMLPQ